MMRRLFFALWIMAVVPLLAGQAARADTAKEDKKAKPAQSTIAVFRLAGAVTEAPADDTFLFGSSTTVSLKDLVSRMKKAAEDTSVKAVVLLSEGGSVGSAQKEELRQAIAQIRAAGKEVYAHADELSMGHYVLLSGVSRISLVPTGDVWITGLYGEAPYVRRLLDKIGVIPDFLTCGEYKSAAEILMRDGPSPAAEKMQNWLLDSLYDTYTKLIAQGRKVEPSKVRAWIDGGPYTAEKAKAAGLIDAVEHREELTALLKSKYGKDVVFDKKYGKKKPPSVDFSSPFAMFSIFGELLGKGKKAETAKNAVGIVYVNGPIVLGGSQPSLFDEAEARSSEIRKALDEAARDDAIKAVVLRIDSPGGSAVASEIILNATKRVKAKKAFVVSMGNVAGSGGYYVACGSDVIYADESTITGSIGVVGGKLVTTGMWNKLGVTFKEYKRGENAGMLSTSETFSKSERERMQAWMNDIYGVFKGHVLDIRGSRLKKPIDEVAGGRVYTGQQALDLGLVDKIGTLQDAVHSVAKTADLTDYDVRVVPAPKNFLERLMEEITGAKEDKKELGVATRLAPAGRQTSLVDLALPYLRHLDPQRVRAVKHALQRLQLLQQEGVLMMMPEIRIAD